MNDLHGWNAGFFCSVCIQLSPGVASGRIIFGFTFAVSCSMFQLIIFEIAGIMTHRCVDSPCVFFGGGGGERGRQEVMGMVL